MFECVFCFIVMYFCVMYGCVMVFVVVIIRELCGCVWRVLGLSLTRRLETCFISSLLMMVLGFWICVVEEV